MNELGDSMVFAASTMHVWVRPAIIVLWGVVVGALEIFMWAVQDR